jgi:hypothetical protein
VGGTVLKTALQLCSPFLVLVGPCGTGPAAEQPPDPRCTGGPTTPGREKVAFTINGGTRVLGDEGCDEEGAEDACADDLAEGQRVRTDYTGRDVMGSYPAQTTARSVVTCSGPTAADRPAETAVFFPELVDPSDGPLLIARGEFSLDGAGRLRVGDVTTRGGLGYVPLWPPQYELETGGAIRVLDGKGRVVAKVEEDGTMGGGGIDGETLEEYGYPGERTMGELFERCPGNDYWMVLGGTVWLSSQG